MHATSSLVTGKLKHRPGVHAQGVSLWRPIIPPFLWVSECCARQANAQLLHTKLKCGALHPETRSRSSRSRKDAVRRFERAQDLGPFRFV